MLLNLGKIFGLILLFSSFAFAEDWTKEQQELLEWEEACISTDDHDQWVSCFHDDFVGWGMGFPVPTSKSDRAQSAVDSFESFDSEVLLFKPLSVVMHGNTAVIVYIDNRKTTNNATQEVNVFGDNDVESSTIRIQFVYGWHKVMENMKKLQHH